jgi:DNA polymerase I-like protein with 3'-5' exonuclease and polymerase domains
MLINVDAKHLDWTAAVYLSQDKVGIKEITDGFDLHTDNQKSFGLPSRLIAKVFLFRIIFGGSAYSFSLDNDFAEVGFNEKQWQEVIDKFYRKYQGIRKWHEELVQRAMQTGHLEIPTGRQWDFVKGYTKRGEDKWPVTTIKNYPVQGLEADLMMIVRVSLLKRIQHEPRILLINSVHDSVLLDVPKDLMDFCIQTIKGVFEDVPDNFKRLFGVDFNLPFRGEILVGMDWLNMEEVK